MPALAATSALSLEPPAHGTDLDGERDRALAGDRPSLPEPAGVGGLVTRTFDLAVCVLVLPAALLLGAITALIIYLDSPGSVFYRSTRVGRGGQSFGMLKFRKMKRSARGGPLTLNDDERFTPIGAFLAMTKLDELPQLWNVLRGEMRLVGPRPEVPEFVARYADSYREILSVLPGITGAAAVEYASESHLLSVAQDPLAYYQESILPRKIELDLQYIRTRSLRGDLILLLRTALVPLRKIARRMIGDPRIVRREAAVFLVVGGALIITFALSSSGS